MRIAIVTPGISGGGTERVTTVLANGFIKRGHEVSVICCYYSDREYELDDAIEVLDVVSESRGLMGLARRSVSLSQHLRRVNPDVVLSFVAPDMVFAQRSCAPTVQTLRNDPWHYDISRSKRFLIEKAFSSAKRVVFQTDTSMRFYSDGIRKKGVVLPNPIETSRLPFWKGNADACEFVAAARLGEQKNYPMMIRAFGEFHEAHPEWNLTIYGDGPERGKLEKLISDLGLSENVALPGRSKEVHERIAEASAFVLSSDFEGVSNSMLEALCIGAPCIVTDHSPGGAREYIEDGKSGLLTKVGDPHDMALAMAKIADAPDFAKRLGERAMCVRERVDVESVVSQWESVLVEVASMAVGNSTKVGNQ